VVGRLAADAGIVVDVRCREAAAGAATLAGHVLGLVRDASVGAVVYIVASGMVWIVRGRPSGIERDLLDTARRKLSRLRDR